MVIKPNIIIVSTLGPPPDGILYPSPPMPVKPKKQVNLKQISADLLQRLRQRHEEIEMLKKEIVVAFV